MENSLLFSFLFTVAVGDQKNPFAVATDDKEAAEKIDEEILPASSLLDAAMRLRFKLNMYDRQERRDEGQDRSNEEQNLSFSLRLENF